MGDAEAPRTGERRDSGGKSASGYWALSTQPWHVLLFLTPFVIAFEAGSLRYLFDASSGRLETIKAKRLISGFFEVFGPTGLLLPGIALLTVLLIWHAMTRTSWRVRWGVLGFMAIESLWWVLPLLLVASIVLALSSGAHGAESLSGLVATGSGAGANLAQPWPARLTIAIGAGLYEEMLFRFIGFAVVHAVVVDLLKLSERTGWLAAILVTSIAFAAYHPEAWEAPLERGVYYLFAGVYLAVLYSARGLGIATATHACFDAAVMVLFPALP